MSLALGRVPPLALVILSLIRSKSEEVGASNEMMLAADNVPVDTVIG